MEWQEIHQNRYILCQQSNMFCLWVSEYGHKRFVGEEMDMSEMWKEHDRDINAAKKIYWQKE